MNEVRLAAFHEAGHLIVADFLELSAHAIVNDDGSGRIFYSDSDQVGQLAPEDRACLTVAGEVAEAMASGGDLKRAVARTFNSASDDLEIMVMAVGTLERSHPQGRDGAAMDAARAALAIIRQNRSEFDRLVRTLYSDRIARVGPEPSALRGGQVAGPVEMRSMASEAKVAGHDLLAKLLEATIAGREGRDVEPFKERRVMGQLLVE